MTEANESKPNADLFFAIAEWDGKSKQSITQIYASYCNSAGLLTALLDLFSSPKVQSGATWLFKKHCETQTVQLDIDQSRDFHAALENLVSWEAQLHVLQSIPLLNNVKWNSDKLLPFFDRGLSSENKFVRAWSYYAYAELAANIPSLRQEAERVIAAGFENENAGSIKARLRKARSRLDES